MFSPEQYTALVEGAGLVDRSARGRLLLTGEDRRTYLQGLLTNDVAALTPGTGCYAAYLTAQGRMIADVRLFEMGDALLSDTEPAVVETVRDRWTTFIFSEDVRIEDITASTAQVGVYGPRAGAALAAAFNRPDEGESPDRAIAADGETSAGEPRPTETLLDSMPMYASSRWNFNGVPAYVLRSDDVGEQGFDVVLSIDRKALLLERLREAGAVAVSPEAVEARRIEAGRPLFGVDMTEDTIPLEAGIQDRAISLTKGCYVGQEIIIRVLHRGHGRVARRLVRLEFEPGGGVPVRGARIMSGDREIGSVTSAVESLALGRPIALGYVHRDFAQQGAEVRVGDAPAVVRPLPLIDERESAASGPS